MPANLNFRKNRTADGPNNPPNTPDQNPSIMVSPFRLLFLLMRLDCSLGSHPSRLARGDGVNTNYSTFHSKGVGQSIRDVGPLEHLRSKHAVDSPNGH
jgi:hypothetical protein